MISAIGPKQVELFWQKLYSAGSPHVELGFHAHGRALNGTVKGSSISSGIGRQHMVMSQRAIHMVVRLFKASPS